ncbi:MAG: HAMP domain-containing sensor histidine kinase [Pseudomonadota bacterium]
MKLQLRTKISIVFAALLSLFSGFLIFVLFLSIQSQMQAIDQSLHSKLATTVLKKNLSSIQSATESDEPNRLFDNLMGINPTAEFYLLDADGRVLSYSAPIGRVKLTRVDLKPIQAFITGAATFPLLGENPRDPQSQSVFSAASLPLKNQRTGYLYAVLHGDAYRSATSMYENSQVLRVAISMILVGSLVTLLVGLAASHYLGRRLGQLVSAMQRFQDSGFRDPVPLATTRRGDEIDDLSVMFFDFSKRISTQMMALEHADQSRRELVMHVTHDMRTPLATLHAYLETLSIKWQDLPPNTRETYLDSALKFSHRLDQLTADLFELATLDQTETLLRVETFPLAELVQDIGRRFVPHAKDQGITMHVDSLPDGTAIKGEIGLVERLLANLIDNAIKYTPTGGEVSVSLQASGDTVEVIVTDTGIGVSSPEVEKIFDRFYRSPGGNLNSEGTGLGLSIARRIAELHGAQITARSEVGSGSTFTVGFPVAT